MKNSNGSDRTVRISPDLYGRLQIIKSNLQAKHGTIVAPTVQNLIQLAIIEFLGVWEDGDTEQKQEFMERLLEMRGASRKKMGNRHK